MSDESNRLLNEGLQLLKMDDRAKAVDVLKRAIEEDSESVEIWVALAQALDDEDEKRIALTTIMQLDPGNEYAKTALVDLDKPVGKRSTDEDAEWIPGVTRRELRLAVLGLVALTVVVCGVTFVFVSGRSTSINGQRSELTQAAVVQTQSVVNIQETNTAVANLAATQSIDGTATQMALTTSTPTPTNTPSRILPTPIPATPIPTETPDTSRIAPPPPVNLAGRIIGWSGRNNQQPGYLDFVMIPAAGGALTRINNDKVQAPTVDDAYSRFVYVNAQQGGGTSLPSVNTVDANPLLGGDVLNRLLDVDMGVTDPTNPSMSRNGMWIVTSATLNERKVLFLYQFATDTVVRLTPDDGADYTAATVNGDGTLVVAVRSIAGSTDLVLINAADVANGYPQLPLTSDGNAIIEANPSFGADYSTLVYGVTAADPNNSDIVFARLQDNQLTAVQTLVNSAGSETRPIISPDGAYVVYTNNATGTDNVFIFDLANRVTYQLTAGTEPTIASGWAN